MTSTHRVVAQSSAGSLGIRSGRTTGAGAGCAACGVGASTSTLTDTLRWRGGCTGWLAPMLDTRTGRVEWVMEELGCRDEGEGFHHCTTHWVWPRDFVEGSAWLCPTAAKIVDALTS